MGRPTKLTPEVQARIVDAILAGNYFDVACRYAGVTPSTAYRWIQIGDGQLDDRPIPPEFSEFSDAIARANAHVEVQAVAKLRQHGQKDPRALIEFLARRFPARWGRNPTVDNPDLAQDRRAVAALVEIAESMRQRLQSAHEETERKL